MSTDYTTIDFVQVGREAFAQGEDSAPALNATVQAALEGRPVGDPANLAIMGDFSKGWHAANLAADVLGVLVAKVTDPEPPLFDIAPVPPRKDTTGHLVLDDPQHTLF
jgi:hypothetical protein